jgi:hypothetical protein
MHHHAYAWKHQGQGCIIDCADKQNALGHNTVPLYSVSSIHLYLLIILHCKLVSNNWHDLGQVELEPCDVWKQQSHDVLV